MQFRFKIQDYQTQAVNAIVDCFVGQPFHAGISYRLAPGLKQKIQEELDLETAFRNADLKISDPQILENIHNVQKRQNLPLADKRAANDQCKINLDVEMETGTGKTYCYIKTIFELNKCYGWSKFIIMVPSIAIREGVYKSFQMTTAHFHENYGRRPRFFIYNSGQLHQLNSFSSSNDIQVMIINIQAFNARGQDNRRIYEEQDSFGTRKPIDVIAANRPILILDEPQKMGKKTKSALEKFKPLMILRYSATHRDTHNKIYRLDALDAYNQKLVKKIAVHGITSRGAEGIQAFLYLESIEISKNAAPVARMEMEIKQQNGIKRVRRRLQKGDSLFEISKGLEPYRGFVISQIDAFHNKVEFTNGTIVTAGEAIGDVMEDSVRRIQIRETIKTHLEREAALFSQGIKTLSLFFIDEVAKYRDYTKEDQKGDYARIFEEEYEDVRQEILENLPLEKTQWRDYLQKSEASKSHAGYFSIDKKRHLVNPQMKSGDLSDDRYAYDLILKDKERLLSFDEPVRFIFSHSALREGWDNPNIFTICMLKQSDNNISRRQEVGRGLRLCVNQQGERMDDPATVHDINLLTVVASESYQNFVDHLQKEISVSLSARPRKANQEYFTGKLIDLADGGKQEITPELAKKIERWLVKNDYTDDEDSITETYHHARKNGTLAPLPDDLEPYKTAIIMLIDSVFSEFQLPLPDNTANTKIGNAINHNNFDKQEFQALWSQINKKAIYHVDFDAADLITKSIDVLNRELKIPKLHYNIMIGRQKDKITHAQLEEGEGFTLPATQSPKADRLVNSTVKYDLLGKIAEHVHLTRKTVADILMGIKKEVFDQFQQNPEHFITQASRLIEEQKASTIIEKITYDEMAGTHDISIFLNGQNSQNFIATGERLKKHIYDYVITDSEQERKFVQELDTAQEVIVYAKLPKTFAIPTPIGNYTPDWAIAFVEGKVKHIYFVAETKGSMSSLQLGKMRK